MRIRLFAIALAFLCDVAAAGPSFTISCFTTGSNAPEAIDDTAGHAMQVVTATCLHVDGPLAGAIATQNSIWEQDLAGAKLLSGDGVARKLRTLLAYRITDGRLQPVMREGKAIGWKGAGKGVHTLASGDAARFAGRGFSWAASSSSAGQYAVEFTLDE